VAEALGIYYKDVGIETEIEVLDWAKVREMFRKKTNQCCIWPNIISWRPSEEWIRTSYYSKGATHHYENEFIDKNYAALTKTVKPEERQRLARAIAAKQVSPVEVTEACLARIERFDRVLNAFVTVTADRALEDARRAEKEIAGGRRRGPLHGIPIAIKDIFATRGIRTTCSSHRLSNAPAVVRTYKQLKMAERAFRTMKDQIEIRPIYHHLEERVRAHALLCMLAYYVAFELALRLAPLLFTDTEPLSPTDPVAPAKRSAAAKVKAGSARTADGHPAHSFGDLIAELGTLARNEVRIGTGEHTFPRLTTPSEIQVRAFDLLGVKLHK
jgi:hypothetical protein